MSQKPMKWMAFRTMLRAGCATFLLATATGVASEQCRIRIVDEANGWPVPLVQLTTIHNVKFVSDNAGVICFDLPELMNVKTWFHVEGHGYSVGTDAFGYSGVRLLPRAGDTLTIKVKRQLPAMRLGRITGAGLFAESQKLGDYTAWKEQRVLGCDSVQNTVHDGKLFWGWGDTLLAHYPLGRFHMIGATTNIQPLESFKPPIQLRYDYVTDDQGTPRNVAKMPGDGPTWLDGYVSLPDDAGRKRLVATYAKIRPPLTVYEKGLCVWNEQTRRFDKHTVVWTHNENTPEPPPMPHGHPVFWKDRNGDNIVLFGDPFPTLSCKATFEAWANPETWKQLRPQSSVPTPGATEEIVPHRGAIAWNAFRGKWVTVFTQLHGDSSGLGEIWYAEAESAFGPWSGATKVVTHNKYSFYNPQLHPQFTATDSAILLFEATFTRAFSQASAPTPRHDYNQILYRLDLNTLNLGD